MPLLHLHTFRNATIGIWRTDETLECLRSMLSASLPYYEELSALHAQSRKMEYLGVRVLLRTLCGEEFHVRHHPSGKPFLSGDGRCISISHTRGYVAVALHPSETVGVDIERRSERVRRAATRFLHPDELPCLSSLSAEEQLTALLLHWSAKETMYKMMDTEGVDFQQQLLVRPFVLGESGVMEAFEMRTPEMRRFEIHYLTHPDFVLTYSVG